MKNRRRIERRRWKHISNFDDKKTNSNSVNYRNNKDVLSFISMEMKPGIVEEITYALRGHCECSGNPISDLLRLRYEFWDWKLKGLTP